MDPRLPGQQPLLDERARQDQRALSHLGDPLARAEARAALGRRIVVGLVLLLILLVGLIVLARLV